MRVIGGKQILTSLEEIVDPAHSALVVVDVQNDFCSADGAWPRRGHDVSGMPSLIANVRRLIDAAHVAEVPVIYIQMTKLPGLKSISPSYLRFMVERNNLDPDDVGCDMGSWGWEVVPEIAPQPGDLVIQKWRSSAFVGTPLDLVLRSNGIQSVVICGVATNACVESTVRDAFNNDYYVVLVEDAVAAYSQRLHEASLAVMGSRVDLVRCDEMAKKWAGWSRGGESAATEASAAVTV
jgi:nicotinamidase-related amidase